MNRAWKGGQKGGTTGNTAKPHTPVAPPKPSPQQTPGKPKPATTGSEPPKPAHAANTTKAPWDQAVASRAASQKIKPLLGKTGASETAGLFSMDEVYRLGMRFRKLDMDSSGSLSMDEFMKIAELKDNPLVKRVVEIFDVDRNGEVDFKEFIQGISHFTVSGNKDKRLRFAFRMYDMDNDGYISNGELFQVMKLMVGTSMADTQLQHIVDTTIRLGDKDLDGKVSFQEFSDLVNNGSDVHKKMIIEGI